MTLRRCSRCSEDKEPTDFNPSQKWCRLCHSEYNREYHLKRKGDPAYKERKNRNKREYDKRNRKDPEYVEQRNLKVKRYYRSRKLEAVELMGGCCEDCGGIYPPCCYDFHHLDPTKKDMNPSTAFSRSDWVDEIEKCVLLCANCHRIRHYEEGECEP